MPTIHLIMQIKGGVGKSFSAIMLAQYLRQHDSQLLCVDTDPGQKSFAAFTALNVHSLQILKDKRIDPLAFDKLIRVLVSYQDSTQHFIIDVGGSASFHEFNGYLIENDTIDTLYDMGFQVIFHTVVVGGTDFENTMAGMVELVDSQPRGDFFIWKNEHFGEVTEDSTGKDPIPFERTARFRQYQSRIMAIVNISKQPPLFEADIALMMKNRMTFNEVDAYAGDLFDFINKRRLAKFRDAVFSQLNVAFGISPSMKKGAHHA